jgi:enoyl-CoA hydratase/carnithine racemase
MSELLIDKSSGVLTITLNRLDKKNSLTRTMYAGMAEALAQADADATLSAAVIQGHETVFSAGNDIGEFLNRLASGEESPAFQFLRAISVFSKPLLAAVCGPAVGIGTTMLFHCDLVYAGDNAAFSMPFVNLGLCPEAVDALISGMTEAQLKGDWQPLEASEERRCALLPRTPALEWDDLMVQVAYMHAQDQLP